MAGNQPCTSEELRLSQVLREEYQAVTGAAPPTASAPETATTAVNTTRAAGQAAVQPPSGAPPVAAATDLSSGKARPPEHATGQPGAAAPRRADLENQHRLAAEDHQLANLFEWAHGQNLAALCLSGGGIRSATYNLGILQGLAAAGVMEEFHYLSTVSGGGYIGSWFTAWCARAGRDTVIDTLAHSLAQPLSTASRDDVPGHSAGPTGAREGERKTPNQYAPPFRPSILGQAPLTPKRSREDDFAPISHLRRYSQFLAPRAGLFSADLWTLLFTYVRNLSLMWVVLIPITIGMLLVPRVYLEALRNGPETLGFVRDEGWIVIFTILGLVSGAGGWIMFGLNRPSARALAMGQGRFLLACLTPLLISSFSLTLAFIWSRNIHLQTGDALGIFLGVGLAAVSLAAVIYLVAMTKFLRRWRKGAWPSAIDWFGVLTVVLGSPAVLFLAWFVSSWGSSAGMERSLSYHAAALYATFAVPGMVAVHLVVAIVLVGAVSRFTEDQDKEWWARCGSWMLIVTTAWIAISALTLFAPLALLELGALGRTLVAAAGGTLGVATTALGFSGKLSDFLGERRGNGSNTNGGAGRLLALLSPVAILTVGLLLTGLALAGNLLVTQTARGVVVASTRFIKALPTTAGEPPSSRWMPPCPMRGALATAAGYSFGLALTGRDLVAGQYGPWKPRMVSVCGVEREFKLEGTPGAAEYLRLHVPSMFVLLMAGLLTAISVAASWLINVNEFSLHAMYRNRLIRCYLGASNRQRAVNPFTDFDPSDDLRLHSILPALQRQTTATPTKGVRLFHLHNMALNLVNNRNLAWQQRKAANFTTSSFHAGCWWLGYRRSRAYGGIDGRVLRDLTIPATGGPAGSGGPCAGCQGTGCDPARCGLSLGTAMTLSGAAVNPNMGYASSTALTLLMTFFNVRLGGWLGNPAYHRRGQWETYNEPSPRFFLKTLVAEAFGKTDADASYINLSDGGHFENLGLYELVLRRCHMIVIGDASEDPEYHNENLANAIRKIRVDLNIQIRLRSQVTPNDGSPRPYHGHCYVWEIDYAARDGLLSNGRPAPNGYIIQLKAAICGQETLDVLNYHHQHPSFPHSSTGDQFYDEPQFESYRALGVHAVRQLCGLGWNESTLQALLARALTAKDGIPE